MQYTVRLGDENHPHVDIEGQLVGEIMAALGTGSKKAVRLAVEGRSEIGGRYPKSLQAGATFVLEGVDAATSSLLLSAKRLDEVLTDPTIAKDVPPDTSALGLFTEGMRDAIAGTPSDLVDRNMIASFEQLGGVVAHVGQLAMSNGNPGTPTVLLHKTTLQRIREFEIEEPISRVVRLSGVLDSIKHSDQTFVLQMVSGHALRGTFADEAALVKNYGKTVVVSGLVHFRPSGRPREIEARHIKPATEEMAELWAKDPVPLEGTGSERKHKPEPQGPRSGMNAVYRKWPVEQSDSEFVQLTKDE